MSQPLRVLLVEDSENDVLLVLRVLEKGGYRPAYEWVDTAEAMAAALQEKAWDVILCDYQMPQFNGPAAIAVWKNSGVDVPLIIVSGAIGEETAVECMRSGASDYIMKDNLPRLVPAIERELKEAESRRARRRAEEALRVSEENFRRSLAESPFGVRIVSQKGETLYVNAAFLDIFDYESAGEWKTPPSRRYTIKSLDEHRLRKKQRRSGQTGEESYELELLGKDGSVRHIQVWRKPVIWGGEGQYQVLYADVTERKRAEEERLAVLDELQESRTSLQGILDNSPLLITEITREGRYRLVNRAVCELYGKEASDIVGKSFWDLLSPAIAQTFEERVARVCEERSVMVVEDTLTVGGTERTYSTTLFPLLDMDGAVSSIGSIADEITERKRSEKELLYTLERLNDALATTIQVMVHAIEARDPYTAGHQQRVADLARAIAEELEVSQDRIAGLHMAGVVHDIGKLSIPAEILAKPTTLSNIEYALMKEHAFSGYHILKDIDSPWPLAQVVYQHHERMDGSGYPRNLKGEEILLEARIMAVADVVESMASHRPYRPAVGIELALEEIENNKGILYDTVVAEACLRLFREKGYTLQDV